MGSFSIAHLLILALVVLVLFGRGRISEMMGDFGKGIKSFKAGINEENDRPATPVPAQITAMPATASTAPYHPRPVTLNGELPIDPIAPPRP